LRESGRIFSLVGCAIPLRASLPTRGDLALGEAGKGFDHLREAERLAPRVDDRLRLGFVLAATCHHYFLGSSPVETRRFGHEALDIANALGNVPLQVVVNFYLGQAHLIWGEARPARDFLLTVLGLLEGAVTDTNIAVRPSMRMRH
jgi:hypothetical protein